MKAWPKLLFLSSTQTSQNLKFIQKCPCLSSLKNKFQWTQNNFNPSLQRSWYELFIVIKAHGPKINPHPAPGCNRSPPIMYFQKMQFLGVFRLFHQVLDWYLTAWLICSDFGCGSEDRTGFCLSSTRKWLFSLTTSHFSITFFYRQNMNWLE